MAQPRMTLPTQLTLRVLLQDPGRNYYGLEICRETGLASGTLYPILTRLEAMGWLESAWEAPPADRPRRRYYQMTKKGAEEATSALASAGYRSGRRVDTRRPLPRLGLGNA